MSTGGRPDTATVDALRAEVDSLTAAVADLADLTAAYGALLARLLDRLDENGGQ